MEYKDYVKELKEKCEVYLQQIEFMGNENSYSDRLLEDIFTSVARLKDFYYKSDIDVAEESVTVVRTMNELKAYLEDKGWSIVDCDIGPDGCPGWEVFQYSPAGEDFSFPIEHNNDVEEAINAIKEYAYNFDEEEHVQLNVGVRGAPGIKELVEDAKAIQEMLDELADGVNFCEVKTIGETLADATRRSEEVHESAGKEVEKDISFD